MTNVARSGVCNAQQRVLFQAADERSERAKKVLVSVDKFQPPGICQRVSVVEQGVSSDLLFPYR